MRKSQVALALGISASVLYILVFQGVGPRAGMVQAAPAAPRKKVEPLVVKGIIKALTKPPRPGSVPYKDCVIALQLSGVKAARGKFSKKQIVVFVWGMRGNKLMPAAGWKPGRAVTLALQPWEKVEGKYGGYNRRELESDEAMSLDTYWGEAKK
jgi:hypothetical protein